MNEWISVKNRLPEEEVPVLVTYLGYNTGEPYADSIAIFSEGEWYWYTDPDNDYTEQGPVIVEITHWMKLPEPAVEVNEAVEICPFCEKENVYPGWNTETDGFVAVCKHCCKEIFLCSECLHTVCEDGEVHNCDWQKTECGSKCHRGTTEDKVQKRYVELEELISFIKEENHNLAGLIQHIREHCPTTTDVDVLKHGKWHIMSEDPYDETDCPKDEGLYIIITSDGEEMTDYYFNRPTLVGRGVVYWNNCTKPIRAWAKIEEQEGLQ